MAQNARYLAMKSNFFNPATRLTILLVTVVLLACGGASQTDIGQEVSSTTVMTANLSPTIASSLALRGDTSTEIPAVVPDQLLRIAEVSPDLPSYDRDDWKHWVDEDRDCQNTRHEVLIEKSLAKVAFKTDRKCQVATGEWFDPYTGETVTDATRLDIDHMIPLKNAHDSGGWAWDKSRKAAFANDMSYADHLVAVTASANRKKGARGPEDWKPTNRGYWCDYAIDWVQIKTDWDFSATKAEWGALEVHTFLIKVVVLPRERRFRTLIFDYGALRRRKRIVPRSLQVQTCTRFSAPILSYISKTNHGAPGWEHP